MVHVLTILLRTMAQIIHLKNFLHLVWKVGTIILSVFKDRPLPPSCFDRLYRTATCFEIINLTKLAPALKVGTHTPPLSTLSQPFSPF